MVSSALLRAIQGPLAGAVRLSTLFWAFVHVVTFCFSLRVASAKLESSPIPLPKTRAADSTVTNSPLTRAQ